MGRPVLARSGRSRTARSGPGRIAWHVITAELHTGMLTLAFASTVIRMAGIWVTIDNAIWRGLVRLAEPTAYLAAIGGLLALIASIATGFTYTWPLEVLLTSSVALNKVAITTFSTTFWVLFIMTRSIYGPRLWASRGFGGRMPRWVQEAS